MINLLTIDLEDYYQVSAFEGIVKREHWGKYESRIERNTYRLLEILDQAEALSNITVHDHSSTPNPELRTSNSLSSPHSPITTCGTKATFFCLGWNAERFPGLIKEIYRRGHEIACHGYDHQLLYTMTPKQFQEDIRKSKRILEDIIGKEVVGYRAPSYSITRRSLWAFEILAQEGFWYDSSVFPIHHDRYGIPNAPRFPFLVDLNGGNDPKFIPSPLHLTPNALHLTL